MFNAILQLVNKNKPIKSIKSAAKKPCGSGPKKGKGRKK